MAFGGISLANSGRPGKRIKLDRETELIVFSPAKLDLQEISRSKSIVANRTVFVDRNVEQCHSLVFLEKRSPGHFSTPRQNGKG